MEKKYLDKGRVPSLEETQALCDDYCIAQLIVKYLPSELLINKPGFPILLKEIKAPFKVCKAALIDSASRKDSLSGQTP